MLTVAVDELHDGDPRDEVPAGTRHELDAIRFADGDGRSVGGIGSADI